MIIEAGKFYRDRMGRKRGPMTLDGNIAQDALGSVWVENGKQFRNVQETMDDLIAEWPSETTSPIREITRKEIVPGVFGCVVVGDVMGTGISICLQNQGLQGIQLVFMDADELDAAASVLTQIAAVLRENSNGK